MTYLRENPRLGPMLVAVACVGALGTAFVSEIWGGLEPCVLCIYQRYVYGVAFAIGLTGVLVGQPVVARAVMLLAGLTFLVGAGVSFFHVGVEYQWWRGTDGCHAPTIDMTQSAEDLTSAILNSPFVPCDQIAWSLFGVTMAGFNTIASLILAVACFWAAGQLARETQA